MLIMQITNLYAKYLIFLQNLVQVIKEKSSSRHYLLKFNNRNRRAICEICSKLTTNTPDFNNFVLVSLLLTLKKFHKLFSCFYF